MQATHGNRRSRARRLVSLLLCFSLLSGCSIYKLERRTLRGPTDPDQIPHFGTALSLIGNDSVLKAHMADGRVYVFEEWAVDGETVAGSGTLLDAQRRLLLDGELVVSIQDVALFETNHLSLHKPGGMTAVTMLSGVVTAMCVVNPKACFGSCPTFFIERDGNWSLVAEGFSASVARALEDSDVDAIGRIEDGRNSLELKLTNEAYETHVIRHANLGVLACPPGIRAAQSSAGGFRALEEIVSPSQAHHQGLSILDRIATMDDDEWYSLADSLDLAAREFIELEFDIVNGGEWGLVVGTRQALLTTYLFYQGLSYLGSTAASWMARLDRVDPSDHDKIRGVGRLLGGIEVQRLDSAGHWTTIDTLTETGPLATDVDVVPLGSFEAGSHRVRLRLTKGMWRIDALQLARLGAAVEPTVVPPMQVDRVTADGERAPDPDALAALLDPSKTLVTLPGDEFRIVYDLPATNDALEVWLESRGYYLEWMREEWLAEENPLLAAEMFLAPEKTLRRLAPVYKALESEMEEIFWGSRYAYD